MYGNRLASYPVTAGSVWKAGPHTFLCGDVIALQESGLLAQYVPQVDCIYTDPPWGQGIRQRFHFYAGTIVPDSFDEFLTKLIMVIKSHATGKVAIDMGLSYMPTLHARLRAAGAQTTAIVNATYGGEKTPCQTWIGGWCTPYDFSVPDGLHGKDELKAIMHALKGETYFDPCCGNLTFAQAAIDEGMIAYGCELIPSKLAQGLVRLSKAGYEVKGVHHAP